MFSGVLALAIVVGLGLGMTLIIGSSLLTNDDDEKRAQGTVFGGHHWH